jgi:acyl-CoA synthetase (AMP-forming)/AMP-acid ligase II
VPSTTFELLRARAEEQPARTAFIFLRDGERDECSVTYGELDAQARAIAARLRAVAAPGDRAVLLYPSGLEFIGAFFGCLYAGIIAVPAYPPDPLRPRITLERLQSIAADCGARVVLTAGNAAKRAEVTAVVPALADATWIATDDAAAIAADHAWSPPSIAATDVAFLQYTSGSTSAPKGVSVTHANILHNERVICGEMGLNASSFGVGWLPLYHDMGLIGNVLAPVHAGFPTALMSPFHFMQKPIRLLRAISRFRATISGGPNFAYEHCVNRIPDDQKSTLDLSSWRIAYNGAEPIRADTLRRFTEAFAPCGFAPESIFPCYGLAESTLMVTGKPPGVKPRSTLVNRLALERGRAIAADESDGTADAVRLASSGVTGPDLRLEIVHPDSDRRVDAGQVGEIWVAGPSVAAGYFGRPEESARAFSARLADDGTGPFLRTGDLGFLHAGELYVTGRIKDVIIVRGRKLHPQDLEHTAEASHPSIRFGGCAAFRIDRGGEEGVALVAAVLGDGKDAAAIFGAIRQALADAHQVQPVTLLLTRPNNLPKTSSGKIQRFACRDAYASGTLPTTAEWHRPIETSAASPAEAGPT